MKSFVAAAIAALMPAFSYADAVACRPDMAIFHDDDTTVAVSVEVADDARERAQGLMHRHELAHGAGMLFLYETPQPVRFWMHNTLISLDMIFIDASGVVRHIHPNARPQDDTPIPGAVIGDPAPDRLIVVEVPGGDAQRLGIRPGMALAHPGVPQSQAKLRCAAN